MMSRIDGAAGKLQERFKRTEDAARKLGAVTISPVLNMKDQATARLEAFQQKMAGVKNQDIQLSIDIDGASEVDAIAGEIESIGDVAVDVSTKTGNMTSAANTALMALNREGSAAKQTASAAEKLGQETAKSTGLMDRLSGAASRVSAACISIVPSFNSVAGGVSRAAQATSQGFSDMSKHINGIKSQMVSMSMMAAGGFGLFKLAESAIEAGDSVYKLSTKMHIPAGEAANLSRMMGSVGVDTNAFIKTMVRMDRQLEQSGKNGSALGNTLDRYGVSLRANDGKFLSMADQLAALSKGYQKAAEAGMEEEYVIEVLGPRGQELLPILRDYADAAEVAGRVKAIGIDPKRAHESSLALKALGMQTKQVGLVMSDAFLPIAEDIIPKLMKQFQALAIFFKEHKAETQMAAQIATYAMEAMAVVKLAQTAVGIAKTLGDVAMLPIRIADKVANPGAAAATKSAAAAAVEGTGASATAAKGAAGAVEGASAAAKPMSMLARAAGVSRLAGRLAVPIGAAMDAYDVYKTAPEDRTAKMVQVGGHWAGALAGGKAGAAAGAAIGSVVPVVGTAAGAAIGGVAGGIGGYFAGDKIGQMVGSAFAGISWDSIKEKMASKTGSVVSAVGEKFTEIKSAVSGTVTDAVSGMQQLPSKIGTYLSEIPGKAAQGIGYGIGLLSTFPGRASLYFSQLYSSTTQWVSQTVDETVAWFEQLPGRASALWQNTCQYVETEAAQIYNSATQWVSQTVDSTVQWFSELPGRASEAWSGVWSAVGNWCSNTYSSVVNWFSQIPDVVSNYFNEAIDSVTSKSSALWSDIKGNFTVGFNAGSSMPGHADGGIFDREHIARFAEGNNPEAIIPLGPGSRGRGIEIFNRVGKIFGIDRSNIGAAGHADGGIFAGRDSVENTGFTNIKNIFGQSSNVTNFLSNSAKNIWQNVSNILPVPQPTPAVAGAGAGVGGGKMMQLNLGGVKLELKQDADEEKMALEIGHKIMKEIKNAFDNRG